MNTSAKKAAGSKAAEFVTEGMTIGLGTGSTVHWTIQALGEMVRRGMRIQGVPTSRQTEDLARALGIPLITFADIGEIDITIDGADEISPKIDLIKGGGGALLREKLVAAASRRLVIIADESKQVPELGTFPLPVEVVPFAWKETARRLASFGCVTTLRLSGRNSYVTDNGNYIVDCAFGCISNPAHLHQELKLLPGVVETGLFVGMADTIVIGTANGVQIHHRSAAL